MRASPFAADFFFPGKFFLFPATLRRPRCRSRNGAVSFFQREDYRLLRWPQLRPERQDFFHRSQPVRELRVQGYTVQIVPDPKPHQVVTRKLWAGHPLPLYFVQQRLQRTAGSLISSPTSSPPNPPSPASYPTGSPTPAAPPPTPHQAAAPRDTHSPGSIAAPPVPADPAVMHKSIPATPAGTILFLG